MKSKLFLFCLTVSFICFSTPLFGQDRLVDNAGLLSPGQAQNIREMLDRVSLAYNFDLVIVTEKDIGNAKPMDYADDYYDYNGYGFGEDFDGCLFLQVTGSRDYWFSTSGRGLKIMNERAFDKLEAEVLKNLKDDKYHEAYMAFVKTCEVFLKLDAKGRNYSFIQQYYIGIIIASWILGLLVGFAIVAVWKKSMNNALPQTQATSYIVPNTLSFTEERDRFLYSTITKTAQPKSTSSGSGGGFHTGSSGRSHGGRGGRY